MAFELLTQASQELLSQAAQLAANNHHATLQPIHTVAAGLQQDLCRSLFSILDIPGNQLVNVLQEELSELPTLQRGKLTIDPQLDKFIEECKKQAEALKDSSIRLEHIILTWSTTNYLPQSLKEFFKKYGFTHERILKQLRELHKTTGTEGADKQQYP
ncbi:MAG TPA: hypothetical protein VLG71_01930, partial [Candidatus Limnocylindria bacterium]|nr:hypothetical protein [Candidatus Limnocylindria bacterium]